MRLRKHAHTGLHQQILVEQKYFGADARIIYGGIIGPSQFRECLR
jgi:hypothetical protein